MREIIVRKIVGTVVKTLNEHFPGTFGESFDSPNSICFVCHNPVLYFRYSSCKCQIICIVLNFILHD